MKVFIDRFEGEVCICQDESGKTLNIEGRNIPPEAREGDVLIIEKNIIWVDMEETKKRRAKIEKMAENLWEQEP
jgi:hypothetical protein